MNEASPEVAKPPRCTHYCPYTDTSRDLNTVGDLRSLIGDLPDSTPFYLFGLVGYDTVYDAEGEYKTQECIEHNGKIHEVTGVIVQVRG